VRQYLPDTSPLTLHSLSILSQLNLSALVDTLFLDCTLVCTDLLEANILSLFPESLARHVESVLADDAALFPVAIDTAGNYVSREGLVQWAESG
jgi:hypothetical protein